MGVTKFEDFHVWQRSLQIAVKIYQLVQLNRDFGFKDQIQRAVTSISNNIAEGFDRGSDRDFKRFLFIALASASEVRSLVHLGRELGYLDHESHKLLEKELIEIRYMINGLSKTLTRTSVKKL